MSKYPQLEDKEWLYKKYWVEKLSTAEIAKEVGCSAALVLKRMKMMNIKTRSLSEANRVKPVRYPQLLDRDWLYQKYWKEGLAAYEIAKELGCVPSVVLDRLVQLDIPRRKAARRLGLYSKYPELYDVDWLKEQYVEKQRTCPDIARSLGCDSSWVLRAIERAGIERRKSAYYNIGKYKYPELHDKDWLVQKYITEELSTKDIATILGCSQTLVVRALNSFEIPISRRKYRKLGDKDFLWQRYIVERKNMTEIAEEVGCSSRTVLTSLRQFGIPIRERKEWANEERYKQKLSAATKRMWKDKNYVRTILDSCYAKPNNFEKRIDDILQKFIPNEWRYNGGFECEIMIGGLIPDFVNINGRKQLIEAFGDPFHDGRFTSSWKRTEFGRKAVFSQFGYDVLILWYSDVKKMTDEEVAEVVKQFMETKTKTKSKKHRKRARK